MRESLLASRVFEERLVPFEQQQQQNRVDDCIRRTRLAARKVGADSAKPEFASDRTFGLKTAAIRHNTHSTTIYSVLAG